MNQTLVSLASSTNCESQDFRLDHRFLHYIILLHSSLLALSLPPQLQLNCYLMSEFGASSLYLAIYQKCSSKDSLLPLLCLFIQIQMDLMEFQELFASRIQSLY